MILLVGLVFAVLALIVGVNVGWRWVLAPLLGWAMLTWLLTSLRSLTQRPSYLPGGADAPVDALAAGERTLFWCEECGTEVLLVVRGTKRAPSHCGQRMNER
ncbi:MAG: hypothetical protein WD575_01865, partial [Nitriliruptoraceae bacterium]